MSQSRPQVALVDIITVLNSSIGNARHKEEDKAEQDKLNKLSIDINAIFQEIAADNNSSAKDEEYKARIKSLISIALADAYVHEQRQSSVKQFLFTFRSNVIGARVKAYQELIEGLPKEGNFLLPADYYEKKHEANEFIEIYFGNVVNDKNLIETLFYLDLEYFNAAVDKFKSKFNDTTYKEDRDYMVSIEKLLARMSANEVQLWNDIVKEKLAKNLAAQHVFFIPINAEGKADKSEANEAKTSVRLKEAVKDAGAMHNGVALNPKAMAAITEALALKPVVESTVATPAYTPADDLLTSTVATNPQAFPPKPLSVVAVQSPSSQQRLPQQATSPTSELSPDPQRELYTTTPRTYLPPQQAAAAPSSATVPLAVSTFQEETQPPPLLSQVSSPRSVLAAVLPQTASTAPLVTPIVPEARKNLLAGITAAGGVVSPRNKKTTTATSPTAAPATVVTQQANSDAPPPLPPTSKEVEQRENLFQSIREAKKAASPRKQTVTVTSSNEAPPPAPPLNVVAPLAPPLDASVPLPPSPPALTLSVPVAPSADDVPPPPPAPPAPTLNVVPPKASSVSGSRQDLLASIAAGKTLKKVPPKTESTSAPEAKAQATDAVPPPPSAPPAPVSSVAAKAPASRNDLLNAIAAGKTLKKVVTKVSAPIVKDEATVTSPVSEAKADVTMPPAETRAQSAPVVATADLFAQIRAARLKKSEAANGEPKATSPRQADPMPVILEAEAGIVPPWKQQIELNKKKKADLALQSVSPTNSGPSSPASVNTGATTASPSPISGSGSVLQTMFGKSAFQLKMEERRKKADGETPDLTTPDSGVTPGVGINKTM